jgi:hypothetical protein
MARKKLEDQPPTHRIKFGHAKDTIWSQNAYGRTDLLKSLREMLKDGHNYFKIEPF